MTRGKMSNRRRKFQKHVECFRDRHGKLRFYFRKGKGARTPLPSQPDSPEFETVYQAARAGQVAQKRERREGDKPGSIGALIRSYLRSEQYLSLRETSRPGYSSRMEMIRVTHGHRSVKGMKRELIVAGIMQPLAGKPGAALDTLKKLRILIGHAIAIGWLTHDPSLGIKRPKTNEVRAWTDVEIAIFEKHWPVGSKQRLAFALHLFTGQRRSDVHRMTWADVSDEKILVVQQKTRRKLVVPLHSELNQILGATDRKHLTIINTEFGKPFTVDGYSQWLRDAITGAGLPLDCQPHGLRKAAGRRLAEAGCSAHEIMSVLGHKTLAEAERYTRDADQGVLATAAMAKLEGRNPNRIAQTASEGLGETQKS